MSDPRTDDLNRWLAAEETGNLDQADALFARVVASHLPILQEPAGLTAGILAALPRPSVSNRLAAAWNLVGARWVRAAVAAAVAVLGVALATLSVSRLVAFASWSVEVLAKITGIAMVSLAAVAETCGAAVAVLVDLGRAAAVVAGSGSVPALIAANAVVACVAFLGLSRLMSPREEFS